MTIDTQTRAWFEEASRNFKPIETKILAIKHLFDNYFDGLISLNFGGSSVFNLDSDYRIEFYIKTIEGTRFSYDICYLSGGFFELYVCLDNYDDQHILTNLVDETTIVRNAKTLKMNSSNIKILPSEFSNHIYQNADLFF